MSNTPQRIIAAGDILPHRFVTPSTSEEHAGTQAIANSEIIGVSGEETKFAPLSDLVTTNNHAEDGDPVNLRGPGEEALVSAGGAFNAGVLLKSDANGQAVAAALTGGTVRQRVGGRSQQAALAANDLIRISVDDASYTPGAT